MSDQPDTWRIRITTRGLTRHTFQGETVSYDETGIVLATVGREYARRDEAVRLDGCQATTEDGTPCANDATGGDYCGVHSDGDG